MKTSSNKKSAGKMLPLENFIGKIKAKRKIHSFLIIIPVLLVVILIDYGLRAPSQNPDYKFFFVSKGESFASIVDELDRDHLIRSPLAFKVFSFLTGSSGKFQPGRYELSPHMNSSAVVKELTAAGNGEIKITIPEGLTVYEVDKMLSNQEIIKPGELIEFSKTHAIEGELFPDTYKLSVDSKVEDVVKIFIDNFNRKAEPILSVNLKDSKTNLILASIIQEEVPDPEDQKIVGGILKKRVKTGMPLQVDASICYIKRQNHPLSPKGCYPLTALDLKFDSPYNTYLHKGWPPGPISSPGLSAIQAAIEPKASPYWFYISDPDTRKTVFSENLEEHNQNILTFLKS